VERRVERSVEESVEKCRVNKRGFLLGDIFSVHLGHLVEELDSVESPALVGTSDFLPHSCQESLERRTGSANNSASQDFIFEMNFKV